MNTRKFFAVIIAAVILICAGNACADFGGFKDITPIKENMTPEFFRAHGQKA